MVTAAENSEVNKIYIVKVNKTVCPEAYTFIHSSKILSKFQVIAKLK